MHRMVLRIHNPGNMRKYTITLVTLLLAAHTLMGQRLGRTTAEEYTAGFESRESIWSIPEYDGESIPIAILNIGITPEVLEQYPALADYRVGLGLTNITLAYFDELWPRFEFVETRDAIKDRMVAQHKASQKGFTANQVNIVGKIVLAKYFVYIECYDLAIYENENVDLTKGIKTDQITQIGLQVKFVDAETGLVFSGSGLGKATTTREATLLNDENLEEVKFAQSSIGVSNRKALETATAKIVKRMIRRKIFPN
jgi:hypothetical protein